jgi:hypothetical protein
MVTPIDVVRYNVAFDQASYWRGATPYVPRAPQYGDDSLACARGAVFGLLLSGFLWGGLIVAGRAVFALIAGA